MIHIYTDGGCRGNGRTDDAGNQVGIGAYAFVVTLNNQVLYEEAKAAHGVTNNIMELMGVIAALDYCRAISPVETIKIFCDSKYVVQGITDWIKGWRRRDWVTATGEPVKNKELWQQLWELQSRLHVYFEWVRGHNGNEFNERADLLCNQALDNLEYENRKQTRTGTAGHHTEPRRCHAGRCEGMVYRSRYQGSDGVHRRTAKKGH